MNNSKKQSNYLMKVLILCEELDYIFYKDILLNQIYGDAYPLPELNFNNKTFDFDWTMSSSSLEMNLTKLHKRITEINFLNNLRRS